MAKALRARGITAELLMAVSMPRITRVEAVAVPVPSGPVLPIAKAVMEERD